MPVVLFYRQDTDYARSVMEFLHDFHSRTMKTIDEIDPDTPEGIELTRLYDIVEYPSMVATTEAGEIRAAWRGLPLPTIDEVSYYA